MAVVLGTSLGNVIRGVPIGVDGYFAMPLFTDFLPGRHPGVFDWYTMLVGVFALCLLAGHGALYLVWKTDGAVQTRSRRIAHITWRAAVPLWIAATAWVQPDIYRNLMARPWSIVLVLLIVASVAYVLYAMRSRNDRGAFLGSCCFLLTILAATMAGNYPALLRSTLDPAQSITAASAAAGSYGLRVALVWWTAGIALVAFYFFRLFRSFAGKVTQS
jgi:cytochrome d ubiquinol oxidase subunit II